MYALSSSYLVEIQRKNAKPSRRLFIGSSDYSAFVLQWPTISKQWDAIAPQTVSMDVSNAAGTFNFYHIDPTTLRSTVSIQLAIADDVLTVFSGTTDAVRFSEAGCTLTFVDKFRRLSDKVIGSTTYPQSYTSSSYLIHDMAWYACTSFSGLSAITSTSNPDIDYASFSSWTSAFSTDNVRCQAYLTGQHPAEVLKRLSTLTQSAIFVENGKVKFARYSIADVPVSSLTNDTVITAESTLDDRSLVNKAWVSGAYNVSSQTFGLAVFDISTASVNSYGLRETLMQETFVWLVDSNSALNIAQRTVRSGAQIFQKFNVKTTLQAAPITIGDTVTYVNPVLTINNTYRIMKETFNMQDGTKVFGIDQTQYTGSFRLDFSSLDSSDVLT